MNLTFRNPSTVYPKCEPWSNMYIHSSTSVIILFFITTKYLLAQRHVTSKLFFEKRLCFGTSQTDNVELWCHVALKTKILHFSKTLISTYESTWCYNLEQYQQPHRQENLITWVPRQSACMNNFIFLCLFLQCQGNLSGHVIVW